MAQGNFDEFLTMEPAVQPLVATEEPTQEEVDALDDVVAEVVTFIHGPNNSSVLGMIGNAQELFQGIGAATFQILLATKQKFEQGGTELPSAVLFGEGGAIHTTVDELFQLAQAAGIPGSEDQDQYSASIMEVMRLAGDHIETTGDDASVGEAQELLIDIEETGPQGQAIPESGDEESLKGTIQRSLDAQNQGLEPVPVAEGAAQAAPQQQSAVPEASGGILNG